MVHKNIDGILALFRHSCRVELSLIHKYSRKLVWLTVPYSGTGSRSPASIPGPSEVSPSVIQLPADDLSFLDSRPEHRPVVAQEQQKISGAPQQHTSERLDRLHQQPAGINTITQPVRQCLSTLVKSPYCQRVPLWRGIDVTRPVGQGRLR